MISIVCVYNDPDLLSKYLLKSLDLQNSTYELILVDNTNHKFKSAAEALNYGGKKANNDYIMFVHQDMDINSCNWLKDAEEFLNSLENLGIAGIAGRSKDKWWPITNILDGIPPAPIAPCQIKVPVSVQTLDECLMIIPKRIFCNLLFDEVTCDNWHLYGIDFSLTVKKMGYDVYVLPLYAYHRSKGFSLSEKYYETLNKLFKKHRNQKIILTTVEDWVTFIPLNFQWRFPFIKRLIVSFFRRF
nr:glycosyltransferase [uncultured Methanobacterium sp.]